MEHKIEKLEKLNNHKYDSEITDISFKFAKEVMSELNSFIKSIVLFGSSSRKVMQSLNGELLNSTEKNLSMHSFNEDSDIDILIVFDDLRFAVSKEVLEFYKLVISKARKKVSKRLHITTLSYTSFYEFSRVADPIVINILRDGFIIYDEGPFEVGQRLLKAGKIRPTNESVLNYFVKSERDFYSARKMILGAFSSLYWSIIDASHALLMKIGIVPETPEKMPELISDIFVKAKLLSKDTPGILKNFYSLSKSISRGHITHMSGKELDHYLETCENLLLEIKKLIEMDDFALAEKLKKISEVQ